MQVNTIDECGFSIHLTSNEAALLARSIETTLEPSTDAREMEVLDSMRACLEVCGLASRMQEHLTIPVVRQIFASSPVASGSGGQA